MRIFAWEADPGTGYWRLRLPLGELAKAGHDVMVAPRMPPLVQHGDADVLVASRTANRGASKLFRQLCDEARMLCVYEADDDFFSVTEDNTGAHRFFVQQRVTGTVQVGLNRHATVEMDADVQADIRANLAAAHLVTVSTPHLAERVAEHTSSPIVVLPNRVPRWMTELTTPWHASVVVAHTGGPSHRRDVGECAKPLRAWLNRHGDVAEFAAYGLDWTDRVASPRGRTRHVRWQGDVPTYLRSLAGVDVGLAPLRDTVFARSKSPLKAMEFGAVGAPVIASDVGPYSGYVRHGETGFLCRTHRDWREALDALTDRDLRHRMGLAGQLQACEHLVEDHAHEWLDAYTAAMSGSVAA